MYEYYYMPSRDIKKCSLVPLIAFILGFFLMYLSNVLSYAYIYQMVGFLAIAIAIFLTTRYIVRKYAYSTQKIGEGDYDFVVNEVSGNRSKVVCRINMDEITDFVYSENGKVPTAYAGKNGKDILTFDYCQDIMPHPAYYLYALLREGKVCVKFSPDDKMVSILESLCPKAYDLGRNVES